MNACDWFRQGACGFVVLLGGGIAVKNLAKDWSSLFAYDPTRPRP